MFSNFTSNNASKYDLRLLPEFNQLQSIMFLDGRRGFTVGPSPDNSKTFFTKTIDSGITWSSPIEITGFATPNEVNFLNDSVGFVCGQSGTTVPVISKTTDGGQTWTGTTFVSAAGSLFHHTKFSSNPGFGIAVGIANTSSGTVARTFDSGSTWTAYSAITGVREIRRVHYISGGTFIAAARSSAQVGIIIRSTDSGSTWTTLRTFTTTEARRLVDLCFINNITGFTVGFNGTSTSNGSATFSKTVNGGTTWSTAVNITGMSAAWGVNFIDANNGIAVGWNSAFNGMVSITNDGGTTWNTMALTQTNFLYYPTSVNGRFWFVGENATQGFIVYKTH